MNRYARQMVLPEIGKAGQQCLANARVLVIGAGGLGSPVLQYLAGAGVGHLTIVDPDVVGRSNLHRQPIYTEQALGQYKAEAARDALVNLNPDISTAAYVTQLDPDNITVLAHGMDVVFDCADSFAATYTASDYCLENEIALITASVLSASGYVGGFCGGAPSVRAVFPDLPSNLATCATAGVMGPVVGMTGSLQAQMGMAHLLRLKPSPLGKLVTIDGLKFSFGSFRFDRALEPEDDCYRFIAPSAITPDDFVVELREDDEAPSPITINARRVPINDFANIRPQPDRDAPRTVLVCRSGLRAWRAAHQLRSWWSGPIALVAARNSTGEFT